MKRYTTTLANAMAYTAIATTRINMTDVMFRIKSLVGEKEGFMFIENNEQDIKFTMDKEKASKYVILKEETSPSNTKLNNGVINSLQNVLDYLKSGGIRKEAYKLLPGDFIIDLIFEEGEKVPFDPKTNYVNNMF